MVATVILCATAVLWTYVLSAGRGHNDKLDDSQAYHQLKDSLMQALTRDIRSSVLIKELNQRSWDISIAELDSAGNPQESSINYAINDKATIITRTEGGKKTIYDFSEVLTDKTLRFRLSF